MVKSELVFTLNEKFPGLHERDARLALNCILGQMADALVQGERLKLDVLVVLI